jgi:hypothetical protein
MRFQFPALLLTLLLGGAVVAASAAQPDVWQGYRGAHFGMTAEQVQTSFAADGIELVERSTSEDGDLILDARRGEGDAATDVRYIFPAGNGQLALVIEFLGDKDELEQQKKRLVSLYGEPWAPELAAWMMSQMGDERPQGAQELFAWGGGAGHRNRFVRLWVHEEHLSVEYLDARLLSGF